jgi:signal transduction histidine kinase
MFEPFVTTKGSSKGGGLGLGLSIARSIVEAHGGRVHARNNDREGATVWFALPHRRTEAA